MNKSNVVELEGREASTDALTNGGWKAAKLPDCVKTSHELVGSQVEPQKAAEGGPEQSAAQSEFSHSLLRNRSFGVCYADRQEVTLRRH